MSETTFFRPLCGPSIVDWILLILVYYTSAVSLDYWSWYVLWSLHFSINIPMFILATCVMGRSVEEPSIIIITHTCKVHICGIVMPKVQQQSCLSYSVYDSDKFGNVQVLLAPVPPVATTILWSSFTKMSFMKGFKTFNNAGLCTNERASWWHPAIFIHYHSLEGHAFELVSMGSELIVS